MYQTQIDDFEQDNWPLVSIIIVTYNSSQFIVNCLEAVRAKTNEPHEIIVFDNASSDNTVPLIREMCTAVRLLSNATT